MRLSLKRKMSNPLQVPTPYPQSTVSLPVDVPIITDPFARVVSTSNDFNLVRMVEEHGPKRLEQIDKELKRLTDQQNTLITEREKIQALVLAITK